jgi:hypothetical protein
MFRMVILLEDCELAEGYGNTIFDATLDAIEQLPAMYRDNMLVDFTFESHEENEHDYY